MKRLIGIGLFMAGIAMLGAARAEAQVEVIANPSVKAVEIAKSELRDVFTGAATDLKGGHVTPVLLKSGAVSDAFLSAYIGKSDMAFRAGWRSLVFSGQASMPRSLDTEAAVVDYVARTEGAVGYISKATPHEGVKVLAVR